MPVGINSLRGACILFSSLTTRQLSVSASEDTGKPVFLLHDPLVDFNAKNPRLLQKAKQKIRTMKELEYLVTGLLWNSSH